jgi:sarcosine oxidase, subunit alpha
MTAPYRTKTLGRIDRGKTIGFSFDGTKYQGVAGDTLASALLANNVHLFGRSFKYHRPRGLLAAGAEEPNALVTIARGTARATPNLRATQVELYEGLVASSQNRFPSLNFDLGALIGLLSPILAAGFYYKTFIRPHGAWRKLYEPLIRRATGLGNAPTEPDPDQYAHRYAHCDVLIAGGGPAGLAAALAAARSGLRVILVDEQSEFGGALLTERRTTLDGMPAAQWVDNNIGELANMGNVTLLPRTTVFGYFPHNHLGLIERIKDHQAVSNADLPRERLWQVRAKEVIIATGAIERPLVFPGNDRPAVMLAGAARTYLNRFGVLVGKRIFLFTADDAAYAAALDLKAAGATIVGIADLRHEPTGPGIAAARQAGLEVMTSSLVAGTYGGKRIRGVTLGHVDANGTTHSSKNITCDALLMSGGWTPSVHLFSQSRGKLRYDEARQMYLPDVSVQHERSAGGANGKLDLASVLADGISAGADASVKLGGLPVSVSVPVVVGSIASVGGFLGSVPGVRKGLSFVDFQNDVTAADIRLAIDEGFRSIEHIKRYTTTGMATDQGKTSNMNALGIAAGSLDRPVPKIGLTSFRMPYTPVTFGTIAGYARGELFDPVRQTPIHHWAAAQGAVFEDVGLWKRARYFPQNVENIHAAVARECTTVRRTAGLLDATTLGKIEVVGPDAVELLNRLYTNDLTGVAVGRCRYGLMLDEAGFVMDDGVVARLADDRFHITTTTSGAARVLAHMEDYLQTEFLDLNVWLTSTTEQWAVIAVQGPRARDIILPLVQDIDLAPASMPHMSVREGRICGMQARIFRISFTGELGFEVNVPSDYGHAVWEALRAEALKREGCVYGTEAMHVLRAEKGYIIVGQDTDGTVTPDDLGLGWAVDLTKPDFVGKRSLFREDLLKPDRRQLVGLLTSDPQLIAEEGAQLVAMTNPISGTPSLGHVTSAYSSAAMGRSIALALVTSGRSRIGDTVHVTTMNGTVPATIVEPVFYDKRGMRLHG